MLGKIKTLAVHANQHFSSENHDKKGFPEPPLAMRTEVLGLANPPHGSMTYVLHVNGSNKAILIDPGNSDPTPVADYLLTQGLGLGFIVLTHEHFDHIAGLEEIRAKHVCPVICSSACSMAITDPKSNFSRYLLGRDVVCRKADHCCEDVDWRIVWNGREVRFFRTPGHSPGSTCVGVDGLLFTGDTLLPNMDNVTRLPGSNKQDLETSLSFLFANFGPETIIYPGHGNPFCFRLATQKIPALYSCTTILAGCRPQNGKDEPND